MRNEGYDFAGIVYWIAGGALAILLLSFVVDVFRGRAEAEEEEAAEAEAADEVFDPMAGGYPVPPLPGQTLPPVPRRRSRQDHALVGRGAVRRCVRR